MVASPPILCSGMLASKSSIAIPPFPSSIHPPSTPIDPARLPIRRTSFAEVTELDLTNRDHGPYHIETIENLLPFAALRTLRLAHNSIRDVGGGLRTLVLLEELDLADNLLTHVRGLETLASLRVLCLEDNALAAVNSGVLARLPRLRTLRLARNRIDSLVTVDALGDLTDLCSLSMHGV